MTDYENRQNWDLAAWPEMYGALKEVQGLVFLSPPGPQLNFMVFTMSSLAAGCRHCQAHGAYGLDRMGVPLDKVKAVTDEESAQWAMAHLGPLGWDIGKHVGAVHEQRSGPPGA